MVRWAGRGAHRQDRIGARLGACPVTLLHPSKGSVCFAHDRIGLWCGQSALDVKVQYKQGSKQKVLRWGDRHVRLLEMNQEPAAAGPEPEPEFTPRTAAAVVQRQTSAVTASASDGVSCEVIETMEKGSWKKYTVRATHSP